MCYRVITHSLRCDMRPVVSDGGNIYVDAFAQPLGCDCCQDASIRPWLRCESHGCCKVTARFDRCPLIDTCDEVIEIHRYVEARPKIREIWNWAVFPPPFGHAVAYTDHDEWCVIPSLDEVLFDGPLPPHLTMATPAFRMALGNLITAGRLIVQTQMQLVDLLAEVSKRRALHDAFHGRACERVLNEWECVARRPIETGDAVAVQMRRVLAAQTDMFHKSLRLLEMVVAGEGDAEGLMMTGFDVVKRDG